MEMYLWGRVGRVAAMAGTAAVLAACGSSPLELSRSTLEVQRGRWIAQGIEDYTFEYHQQCECAPAFSQPALVEVRGGRVVDVEYVGSGEGVDPEAVALFPTIDDLFERIDDAIHMEAASLVVSYDQALGYPKAIEIDYDMEVVDDEVNIDAWNLAPF